MRSSSDGRSGVQFLCQSNWSQSSQRSTIVVLIFRMHYLAHQGQCCYNIPSPPNQTMTKYIIVMDISALYGGSKGTLTITISKQQYKNM